MGLDPNPARLYRRMRRIGLATLPVGALAGVGIGIAFGVVPGVVVGVVLVSLSLYQAVGFPYVNERLRRRLSASQGGDSKSDPHDSANGRELNHVGLGLTKADDASWIPVRRRFIRGVCLALLLFAATGLGIGVATGDLWRAILVSSLGLFFLGSSLCIGYLSLRGRYARTGR